MDGKRCSLLKCLGIRPHFYNFQLPSALIATGKKDGGKDVSGRGGHELFRDFPDFLLLTTLGGEESSEESDRGNVEADLANSVNYLPDLARRAM